MIRLPDRFDPSRATLLYGAGQLAAMALDLWPDAVPRPVLLIDEYSARPDLQGIPVRKLADVPDARLRSAQIVLAAFKASIFEILSALARRGARIDATVYDVFERYLPGRFSNGWRLPEGAAGAEAALAQARALLADARSRETFEDVVAWRCRREIPGDIYGRIEDESAKYFNDLTAGAFSASTLVVDGGCYDGAFLLAAAARSPAPAHRVGFEPDPASFERTRRALDTAGLLAATTLRPEALHARTSRVPFFATGGLSARIVEPGSANTQAAAVALDDSLLPMISGRGLAVRSPVLKLHIEGAELPALEGARRFVQQFRPLVLVNGSHNDDGLLRIPHRLRDLGYERIHMRSHAIFGEGVTYYAL
jgi:FkbM family methyltransferase